MTQRGPERWVMVPADPADPSYPHQTNKTLSPSGPSLWIGPQGEGRFWRTDLTRPLDGDNPRGTTWTSELGEVRVADVNAIYPNLGSGDLVRWFPNPGPWLLALEQLAFDGGYLPWEPPPSVDSDGDGVPDDQDADPYDPTVQ